MRHASKSELVSPRCQCSILKRAVRKSSGFGPSRPAKIVLVEALHHHRVRQLRNGIMSIRRFCTGQAPGTNTRRSPEPVSGIFGIQHTSKTISHGNLKNITSSRHRGVSPPTPLPPYPPVHPPSSWQVHITQGSMKGADRSVEASQGPSRGWAWGWASGRRGRRAAQHSMRPSARGTCEPHRHRG